jgi:hypothetical protein
MESEVNRINEGANEKLILYRVKGWKILNLKFLYELKKWLKHKDFFKILFPTLANLMRKFINESKFFSQKSRRDVQ